MSSVGTPRRISPLRRLRGREWSPIDRTVVIAVVAIVMGCLFIATSMGRLSQLSLNTTLGGGQARITVTGPGMRPVVFTLRRATLVEIAAAFDTPAAACRIASGATALVHPSGAQGGVRDIKEL